MPVCPGQLPGTDRIKPSGLYHAVANVKYKQPVTVGDKLIAKADVIRQRDQKYYVWVTIRKMRKEVFRAKFIIESLE